MHFVDRRAKPQEVDHQLPVMVLNLWQHRAQCEARRRGAVGLSTRGPRKADAAENVSGIRSSRHSESSTGIRIAGPVWPATTKPAIQFKEARMVNASLSVELTYLSGVWPYVVNRM